MFDWPVAAVKGPIRPLVSLCDISGRLWLARVDAIGWLLDPWEQPCRVGPII